MKEGKYIRQSGLGVGKKLDGKEPFEYQLSCLYEKGKLIQKSLEFNLIKTKGEIREYKNKIESHGYDSVKDFLDLGFDQYETKPKEENTFLFINKKGDIVILNIVTKDKKVYLKP